MITNIGKQIRLMRFLLVRNTSSRATSQPRAYEDFGRLSRSGSRRLESVAAENKIPDDADLYDREEIDRSPRKNEFYYNWAISGNARKGRNGLKRALELFEEMKSHARLTPHTGHYSGLIYGCAKAGQTKKAFELYEEALKHIKKPTSAMITSLIDACSESPFPEYGLKRLDWLRTHLKTRFSFIELGEIHYNCMIKAYGKLGRMDLATEVFQGLINAGFHPNISTFDMLMIGCASQKETGSLLALRLYKRMRLYEIKPDAIFYGNFLRCINYCGMGSAEQIRQTLAELPAMTPFEQRLAYKAYKKNRPVVEASKEFAWLPSLMELGPSVVAATDIETSIEQDEDVKLLGAGDDKLSKEVLPRSDMNNDLAIMPSFLNCDRLPNLFSDDHLTLTQRIKKIDINRLRSGMDRLKLFGGAEGFLDTMKRDGAEPNIKLFSRLTALVEPDSTGLLPLFQLVKEYPIVRTEQFYNNLIKYTCENFKMKSRMNLALTFMEEMHRDNVRPNVTTFEQLASACDTVAQALTLIDDIERCGYVVSDKLIGTLFRCAARRKDFGYIIKMIDLCQEKFEHFAPTRELLEALETTIVTTRKKLVDYEKGKITLGSRPWLEQNNLANYDTCKQLLGKWLRSLDIRQEEHPWEQFDVERVNRRQGFDKYVREFESLEKLKRQALERGEQYGNLYAKVIKVNEQPSANNETNRIKSRAG